MLSLIQLRSFVEVVDRGSFTDAASVLAYSVSAVSLHVANLEKRVGCELLRRRTSSVVPTAAGERLYLSAIVMLHEHARLIDAFDARPDDPLHPEREAPAVC